jgi:hypothetical protein
MQDSEYIKPPGNTFEVRSTLSSLGLAPGDSVRSLEIGLGRIASNAFEDRVYGFRVLWCLGTLGNAKAANAYASAIEKHVEQNDLLETVASHYLAIAANWREISSHDFDLAASMRASRQAGKEEQNVTYFDMELTPVTAGFSVLANIGDPMSAEGRSLRARFAPMVGRPLPRRSLLPAEGAVSEAISMEFPWAASAAATIERTMSIIRDSGSNTTFNKPLLLIGEPGTGKTSLAVFIARLMARHYVRLAVGGTSDTSTLAATSRGWSNFRPSLPAQAMLESFSCDPCIIVDELDKSAPVTNQNGSVMGALLGMTDKPDEYQDTALMAKLDLSHVLFIATANRLEPINPALLDRFTLISVPRPGPEHFERVLDRMRRDKADELGVPAAALPMFDVDEYGALKSFYRDNRGSLRSFSAAYDIALRSALQRQNERKAILM